MRGEHARRRDCGHADARKGRVAAAEQPGQRRLGAGERGLAGGQLGVKFLRLTHEMLTTHRASPVRAASRVALRVRKHSTGAKPFHNNIRATSSRTRQVDLDFQSNSIVSRA